MEDQTLFRTHGAGTLRPEHAEEKVILSGWVHRRRDLGGLIFIDVRDRSGIVQIVVHPEQADAFQVAETLRNEYVIRIEGKVVRRAEETVNPDLPTGEVEVIAWAIDILNTAQTPPFSPAEHKEIDEKMRLRYRYLDLRRSAMQNILILRHQVTQAIRRFLSEHDFVEVETPMLTKSTPEGARDFLVPSRLKPGSFYALPQSPQIYKQLLMVAGLERYFQVARCFRDEDLRADRQPEFTQIDIEMSFMPLHAFQDLIETMMQEVTAMVTGVHVPHPFPRISYTEAMDRYGSDKPDTRFGLEIVDVSETVKDSPFQVFRQAIAAGGVVRLIRVPDGAGRISRKDVGALEETAKAHGAKGLAWLKIEGGTLSGPLAKFISEDELGRLREVAGVSDGDMLFFGADQKDVVRQALGAVRLALRDLLGLVFPGQFQFLWVTDFPLLEYDPMEKRYVAVHHPFTRPKEEDRHKLMTDPLSVRAEAYDLVLNGYEIGGGSLRIYRREEQDAMFRLLGLSEEEVAEKFGFFVEAFEYGAPPHGGIALGLDRIIAILAGRSNLRDVIAFPKTQSGTDLMMDAPGRVRPEQLAELGISVRTN
ncbi:MAG: aspartate--tRNA ligase [Candidatus Carbobacillus altaicus]|nr:aspartate--tRNA ligase [Candidatus Carbobacillus altaicus]